MTTIETDYLQNSFDLLMQVLLFFGALAMMCWYSPTLTLLAVVLSLPPIVLSLLTGEPMAKRAKDVSDRNEGFMAQIKDLLSGFAVIKSFKAEKEVGKLFDSANRAVEKLAQVTEEHAGRAGDPVPPELNDAITLEKVTFCYEPEKPVLREIDTDSLYNVTNG